MKFRVVPIQKLDLSHKSSHGRHRCRFVGPGVDSDMNAVSLPLLVGVSVAVDQDLSLDPLRSDGLELVLPVGVSPLPAVLDALVGEVTDLAGPASNVQDALGEDHIEPHRGHDGLGLIMVALD